MKTSFSTIFPALGATVLSMVMSGAAWGQVNTPPATNRPPRVQLVNPPGGAVFPAPADILLVANAADEDGYMTIQTVEFFEGTNSLGIRTNFPTMNPLGPFFLQWTNVPAGNYVLTAKATDDKGAWSLSMPVRISVGSPVTQPVVTIVATDDTATEIPLVPPGMGMPQRIDMAVFTVSRNGPTNIPLTVNYTIGGTAVNGVDYTRLPGTVVIPAGARAAIIGVDPIDDPDVEGTETVVIKLEPIACIAIYPPPPDCYLVGQPAVATARLLDDDSPTNPPPPVVTIAATDPDASEAGPDEGVFTVNRTGSTSQPLVVFYGTGGTAQNGNDYQRLCGLVLIPAGAASAEIVVKPVDDRVVEPAETVAVQLRLPPLPLGAGTGDPTCPLPANAVPLPYVLGRPDSAVVTIADNDLGTSNLPPTVRITAPVSGAVFRPRADIVINAVTIDPDGYAPSVEFFANDVKIGEQEIVFIQAPPAGQPIHFDFTWSNLVAGAYVLAASTTDAAGARAVSNPVRITVTESNVPPTNLPPVVSLVATDPYASEGLVVWVSNVVIGANAWCANAIDGTNIIWRTNGPVPPWGILCPWPAGTNTATFQVRRSGSIEADLIVHYAIGGTASNGLDYVALPGTVTIPAGARSARITVLPTDDAVPEKVETVVLALRLPASSAGSPGNVTPPYVIGLPGRAAAYIADNDLPPPPCRRFPDGLFHVVRPGADGWCYRVEVSTNLVDWTVVCTNSISDGAVRFVDPDAPAFGNRFYRMIPQPCEPGD
jgi:hypothetical protein